MGFMASNDLKEYMAEIGQAGVGNMGLRDQANAIAWVRKHIAGFRGDANNITLYGESAGAGSTHMQFLLDGKSVRRAILQSATAPNCRPLPLQVQEQFYQNILRNLDIDSAKYPTARERIEALRAVPFADILKANAGGPARPTLDGHFVKQDVTFDLLTDSTTSYGRPDGFELMIVICNTTGRSSYYLFLARQVLLASW